MSFAGLLQQNLKVQGKICQTCSKDGNTCGLYKEKIPCKGILLGKFSKSQSKSNKLALRVQSLISTKVLQSRVQFANTPVAVLLHDSATVLCKQGNFFEFLICTNLQSFAHCALHVSSSFAFYLALVKSYDVTPMIFNGHSMQLTTV